MASTFKTLLNDDVVNTRTLLHESIPITGTIASGTYNVGTTENNIKNFSHGMFQSTYDYPFLSSSANHIFDVTFGISSNASGSGIIQNSKKLNMYNQMAQVLMGYTTGSQIRKFDKDGTVSDLVGDPGIMNHCFFVNFSRLLVKDEVKKGSFRLSMLVSGSGAVDETAANHSPSRLETIGDFDATNEYRTSPAGDYGLLFTSSANTAGSASIGLLFYQAGIAVLTASVFHTTSSFHASQFAAAHPVPDELTRAHMTHGDIGRFGMSPNYFASQSGDDGHGAMHTAMTGATIQQLADGFRDRVTDIQFNNTIELNSTIYFCRVNHNEFNYSANPTYVSGSKLVVKNNVNDLPISYITTVGMYSADNELLAVAKLSEPIRKDPNTELTLRVRLDY
jgi:hypothetical protein